VYVQDYRVKIIIRQFQIGITPHTSRDKQFKSMNSGINSTSVALSVYSITSSYKKLSHSYVQIQFIRLLSTLHKSFVT
jgi:hypothetical protein